jgi:ABC-2 type transport system ATP-binding protein
MDAPVAAQSGAPLAVAGVSHAFGGREVLHDVALTIERGQRMTLLGLNGAGKTTLFSLITRLYDHRSGSIRIFGFEIKENPSEALARIGAVFQQSTLDLDLSVAQNLYYHAALHGIPRRIAGERIAIEIERVGLTDRLRDKVRQLSGGQRRRVEIARALLHRPQLLLLDEPTVGLDIGSRESVINIVRSLVEREGLGVLWATHLFDEVRNTDLVVILHKGRVLFEGTVPDFLAKTGTNNVSDAFRAVTGTPHTEMAA